jgi:hypothetical protein
MAQQEAEMTTGPQHAETNNPAHYRIGGLRREEPHSMQKPTIQHTTGLEAFAESEVPLGEGGFPLVEGFTERKLSAKASRRHSAGEGVFAESLWDPSRRTCAERPT